MKTLIGCSMLLCGAVYSTQSFALCHSTGALDNSQSNNIPIRFGSIYLSSTYLQPVGSLIDRVVVPATDYTAANVTPNTVLWICDKSDLKDLLFLVATNADDGAGGQDEVGLTDGLAQVYATYFQNVGLKLSMQGISLSRRYQGIAVSQFLELDSGKIHIRLMDIPPLIAEIYRVSTLKQSLSLCPNNQQILQGPYLCQQANAYIQLRGPGLLSDELGEDAALQHRFLAVNNGLSYGMQMHNVLHQEASCVVRHATPVIVFAPISRDALEANHSVAANFQVSIECADFVDSGVAPLQTAVGIQVSYAAYQTAQRLGLVNAQNGVLALLSDQYDDAHMAQGVGIFLRQQHRQQDMFFVGHPAAVGGGEDAGWYPVLDGAQQQDSVQQGYRYYVQNYTARLQKLPLATPVRPGKVSATAYILVKVQ
ncbi:adhesin [Acinetobacter larvae]|uniref:Adhesin n=2 Tax=Acinetobacter larvae TaxID=1789224 RepID=A0A1B2M3F9_9GAMM|nr:adhesin [Acinetobacter larvae]